jgi:WD40 repeat protein
VLRGSDSSQPDWSPDGTKIAFRSAADGNLEIHVMNADGTTDARLTTNPASDSDPDWQRLAGPQRSDYKNAAKFCQAERDFLGEASFREKYGGGANAHGKCVGRS